jgi:hypothetical protein
MGADLNDFTKWKGACTTEGLVPPSLGERELA